MAKTLHLTDRLVFQHPWINRADTKFNTDGLFHVDGVGNGPKAEKQAQMIEAAAKQALAEATSEMKPADAKKWELYLPFERKTDDAGVETGEIEFQFKQNAKIELKDGSTKDVTIEIRDSQDKVVDVAIFSGTEGRIMFTMRPIIMHQSKKAGVRLDFMKVQVIKLQKGSSKGFGAVEDDDAYVGGGFGQQADDEQGGEY